MSRPQVAPMVCETCRFFNKMDKPSHGYDGCCLVNPPVNEVLKIGGDDVLFTRPLTFSGATCVEHDYAAPENQTGFKAETPQDD